MNKVESFNKKLTEMTQSIFSLQMLISHGRKEAISLRK